MIEPVIGLAALRLVLVEDSPFPLLYGQLRTERCNIFRLAILHARSFQSRVDVVILAGS